MKAIAVIGAGISGLAAAYFLSRRHRVDLFEQERRLGGHTNTVLVDGPNGTVPLDTGFLPGLWRNCRATCTRAHRFIRCGEARTRSR